MNTRQFLSHSVGETEVVGQRLALALEAGIVIGLTGPLGAGKTQFVRGLAIGLGIDPADVSSPTFVLCHEYHGRLTLNHFDAYRLGSPQEFAALGTDEIFSAGGVSVVEWSDRVADCLPGDRLEVRLSIQPDDSREIVIQALGPEAVRQLHVV